jgi:uncharacterized protein YecT (DUF1311 family)
MTWLALSVAAMGFLTLSATAHASEPEFSKTFTLCMEKSGGVTSAMLECSDAETELQDVRLNKAFQALMKSTPAKRQTQLRNVQRLWISYRKANCDFYADPDKGTSAVIATASCFLSHTAARAKELEDLAE